MTILRLLLLALVAGAFPACSTTRISSRAVAASDPQAEALLAASKAAHGGAAFKNIRDISVSYDGKWGNLVPKLQPVLVDSAYRQQSEERLLVGKSSIGQLHQGPSGKKAVLWEPGSIQVAYEGAKSTDPEVGQAAALVADAYRLFLLGPHFFERSRAILSAEPGSVKVNDRECDQLLAVIKPGFGLAPEDRVVLSIDRETKVLHRVRMTLNGLESTQGAEVDITFEEYRKIGGVLWPVEFVERIRLPFDLHAHRWRLTGLDVNRGLSSRDLGLGGWSANAARPAKSLP